MVTVTVRRSTVLIAMLALVSSPGGVMAQSPSPDDGLDAALAAVELMNKVPASVMATCVPGSPSLEGQDAVAQCHLGADTVIYASFRDVASMAAAYEGITAGVSIEGVAASCADGAFAGTYRAVDGVAAGKVICQVGDPNLLLAWTDDRNFVVGVLALADETDFGVLHERWLRVRLDAPATAAASPSAASPSAGIQSGSPPAPRGSAGGVALWAVSAVASSEYSSGDWSASQASGAPDTTSYGDHSTAWAPAASEGGEEWIELTYERSVVPAGVDIRESSGAGCVTRVEAWDEGADAWVVLWEGMDPSPDEFTVFSPPLDAVTITTQRIRVTIDTSVPGWNEIDAVSLVGT